MKLLLSLLSGIMMLLVLSCSTDPGPDEERRSAKVATTTRQPGAGTVFRMHTHLEDATGAIAEPLDVVMDVQSPTAYLGVAGVVPLFSYIQDEMYDTVFWHYLPNGDLEVEDDYQWRRYPIASMQWNPAPIDTVVFDERQTIEQAMHNIGTDVIAVNGDSLKCAMIISDRITRYYRTDGSLRTTEVYRDTTWFARSIGFIVKSRGYASRNGEAEPASHLDLESYTLR